MAQEMLKEIQERVGHLAGKIGAPNNLLPTYGHSIDFAHPHIECAGPNYYYVITERGYELERRVTGSLDELLYWVFRDVTSVMASSYELENRNPKEDFRRIMFAHQLKLLGVLSDSWRQKRKEEIETILGKYPYED